MKSFHNLIDRRGNVLITDDLQVGGADSQSSTQGWREIVSTISHAHGGKAVLRGNYRRLKRVLLSTATYPIPFRRSCVQHSQAPSAKCCTPYWAISLVGYGEGLITFDTRRHCENQVYYSKVHMVNMHIKVSVLFS